MTILVKQRVIEKVCTKCSQKLPLKDFRPRSDRPGKYASICRFCMSRLYVDKAVEAYWRNRIEFLTAMGGRCVVCGFDDYRALQVDHIKGGGGVERETLSSTSKAFYTKVLKNRDKYQLLCANHNAIKKVVEKECKRPRIYELVA